MYYAIGASMSSLHRESTESLVIICTHVYVALVMTGFIYLSIHLIKIQKSI